MRERRRLLALAGISRASVTEASRGLAADQGVRPTIAVAQRETFVELIIPCRLRTVLRRGGRRTVLYTQIGQIQRTIAKARSGNHALGEAGEPDGIAAVERRFDNLLPLRDVLFQLLTEPE